MKHSEIKEDLKTINFWKIFFQIIETYNDKDALDGFVSNKMPPPNKNVYQISIKKYFEYCKKESLIKRISLKSLEKCWFVFAELRQDFYTPFTIVGAIGGSPIYGSDRKHFNTIKLPKNESLNYNQLTIMGGLTPLNKRGFVSLQEIKNYIDTESTPDKKPKNLQTYLNKLTAIANEDVSTLRGYDSLSNQQQLELSNIIGVLRNSLGEGFLNERN